MVNTSSTASVAATSAAPGTTNRFDFVRANSMLCRPTWRMSHDEERANSVRVRNEYARAPRHWLNPLVRPRRHYSNKISPIVQSNSPHHLPDVVSNFLALLSVFLLEGINRRLRTRKNLLFGCVSAKQRKNVVYELIHSRLAAQPDVLIWCAGIKILLHEFLLGSQSPYRFR